MTSRTGQSRVLAFRIQRFMPQPTIPSRPTLNIAERTEPARIQGALPLPDGRRHGIQQLLEPLVEWVADGRVPDALLGRT